MDIRNEVLVRVYLIFLCFLIVAGAIVYKTVEIGIIDGDKWRSKGDSLYLKYMPIGAERGNILANDGSPLAVSLPFFEIRMDLNPHPGFGKLFEKHLDSLAFCLATKVDNSYTVGGFREKLLKGYRAKNRYLLIRKNVSYDELDQIRSFPLFNLGRYRGGLIVKRQEKRIKPFKSLAARTIGYTKKADDGVGLEGSFNRHLAGEAGMQLMQRVVPRTWIPVDDLTLVEPKSGSDIRTTLDMDLQDITHEALKKAVLKHKAEWGTAAIMEVRTGKILAVSNIGKYKGDYGEFFNYFIGHSCEPGSTFKLATIMSLLEDGYVSLEDSVDLERGTTKFYDEEMHDASYHEHEFVNVRTAFEISSNVGIAKLAYKFYSHGEQPHKFINRLKQFRLDQKVGIEIEGEDEPLIKEPYNKEQQWSGTTIPWMSIGYETQLTPVQLLSFYNAVANDGIMMKPYLVDEIVKDDKVLQKFKPTVLKGRLASKSTIERVKSLLEGVVERGTARSYRSDDYEFAGKTGTVRIHYERKQRHQMKRYQASFAGYFPADDPQYTCIVVVNDPKEKGYYGSEVATPVFKEIADKCMSTKWLHKPILARNTTRTLTEDELPQWEVGYKEDIREVLAFTGQKYIDQNEEKWTVLMASSDSLFLKPRKHKKSQVPNVVGMGLRDAIYVLENEGLKVRSKGVGRVKKQSVKPGTPLKGQTVYLNLG